MEVKEGDVVLCTFYFSDLKSTKIRPVLVLKDNLPYDDFIGVPISSKINNLYIDEHLIYNQDFNTGSIPKKSKIMFRKPFVVSKSVVVKKYGSLTIESFAKYHQLFCKYFKCQS